MYPWYKIPLCIIKPLVDSPTKNPLRCSEYYTLYYSSHNFQRTGISYTKIHINLICLNFYLVFLFPTITILHILNLSNPETIPYPSKTLDPEQHQKILVQYIVVPSTIPFITFTRKFIPNPIKYIFALQSIKHHINISRVTLICPSYHVYLC